MAAAKLQPPLSLGWRCHRKIFDFPVAVCPMGRPASLKACCLGRASSPVRGASVIMPTNSRFLHQYRWGTGCPIPASRYFPTHKVTLPEAKLSRPRRDGTARIEDSRRATVGKLSDRGSWRDGSTYSRLYADRSTIQNAQRSSFVFSLPFFAATSSFPRRGTLRAPAGPLSNAGCGRSGDRPCGSHTDQTGFIYVQGGRIAASALWASSQ